MMDKGKPLSAEQKASKFLKIASQFRLGKLSTERPHPKTHHLSMLAQTRLPEAINVLKKVDIGALDILIQKSDLLRPLYSAVKKTLRQGGKIFICGCGATGRLALSLEYFWRSENKGTSLKNSVIGFMSGGDAAIIRSIEYFEDHPEYGARQLMELGYTEKDLFIGCTEGGETPYVIGATEAACEVKGNDVFFIYGNPDKLLRKLAIRSKNVLRNSCINKINLDSGPMAVAGSTRMQSSTLIMAAVGMVLQYINHPFSRVVREIKNLRTVYNNMALSFLESFICCESGIYQDKDYVLYRTNKNLAITILTDTTERSPTFSLRPFENERDVPKLFSLCYLYLPGAKSAAQAWTMLFNRKPRTLIWPDKGEKTGNEQLLGFDISNNLLKRRLKGPLKNKHHEFEITGVSGGIAFRLEQKKYVIPIDHTNILQKHLILKMILNIHSTLVMGRLKRYEGNLMTWVYPTNNKLIDRAVRYIQMLAAKKGVQISYSRAVKEVFLFLDKSPGNNSVVVECLKNLTS
ncbi:MAG: hypothetical protein HQK83_07680 [Fibrobacteria bacterium]|nr:hypothetical protein [Fibrobacteria bacterium]